MGSMCRPWTCLKKMKSVRELQRHTGGGSGNGHDVTVQGIVIPVPRVQPCQKIVPTKPGGLTHDLKAHQRSQPSLHPRLAPPSIWRLLKAPRGVEGHQAVRDEKHLLFLCHPCHPRPEMRLKLLLEDPRPIFRTILGRQMYHTADLRN